MSRLSSTRLVARSIVRSNKKPLLCDQHRLFSQFIPLKLQSNGHASGFSVNQDEIAFFSRLSSRWWDESGEYGQLHKMNPKRVEFIREKLFETVREEQGEHAADRMCVGGRPFSNLRILDVGCGGGLLSESLARLGARTTAIDASASNIAIATTHASADPLLSKPPKAPEDGSLQYIHTSAEELLQKPERFDVVCTMEVIEHVDNPAEFLRTCAELVKPGGHLFLSSIARTAFSYLSTILVAEKLLGFVSEGTHTHSKYINPGEVIDFFSKYRSLPDGQPWITHNHRYNQSVLPSSVPSRHEAEVRGLIWEPFRNIWHLAPRSSGYGLTGWATTQCNYVMWVRKPLE